MELSKYLAVAFGTSIEVNAGQRLSGREIIQLAVMASVVIHVYVELPTLKMGKWPLRGLMQQPT
jgi:hypothetical protein